jgi:hypothetical protein
MYQQRAVKLGFLENFQPSKLDVQGNRNAMKKIARLF